MVPVTDKTYCLPVKHHLHPPPLLPRPLSSHTLSLPPLEVMDRVLLILDCYTVRAHELEPKFTYIKQISVEIQPPELVSRHRGLPDAVLHRTLQTTDTNHIDSAKKKGGKENNLQLFRKSSVLIWWKSSIIDIQEYSSVHSK